MKPEFAKVAVNLATNKPIKAFTYKIPEGEIVALGSAVVVPFRNSLKAGFVIGFDNQPQIEQIKPIISVIKELSLSAENRSLAKWIADHYLCSEWAATKLFLPPGSDLKIKEAADKSSYTLHIRNPRKEITKLEPHFSEDYETPKNLTKEQAVAVETIEKPLLKSENRTFLLQGITGSGKTEVYARSIETAIRHGKSAILLVPEIAMSIQLVARLSDRFKDRLAILHSGLNSTERLSQWRLIKEGKVPLVIGARSAIFAPLKNIGLIIVDEEHESAYKQNRSPRYNARDVAIKRAELSKAVCVLGSATPSMESRRKCDEKLYEPLLLTTKPAGSAVTIKLADMRQRDEKALLSSLLVEEIHKTLDSNQKVLLLLNRRGYSAFLLCPSCGFVAKCKRCSVSLTYHSVDKSLRCHHCDFQVKAPASCPKCASTLFKYAGSGTQKLEAKINEMFDGEVIVRLDRDSKGSKKAAQALNEFSQAKRAIILGTQIIGKGLDFKDIALVGIVNADTSLNFCDFRSGERTFQLLHQVAGRCGRGKKSGQVIIQTYNSDHYAIKAALKGSFEDFYAQEINYRKELNYPPFSRLINIGFSSADYELCKEAAAKLASILKTIEEIEVLGPTEAPIRFLKNRYRWHILLKTGKITPQLKKTLAEFSFKNVTISVDIDPLSLL